MYLSVSILHIGIAYLFYPCSICCFIRLEDGSEYLFQCKDEVSYWLLLLISP